MSFSPNKFAWVGPKADYENTFSRSYDLTDESIDNTLGTSNSVRLSLTPKFGSVVTYIADKLHKKKKKKNLIVLTKIK